MVICPRCNKKCEDILDIEIIEEYGYCLACEHVDGENLEELRELANE